MEERRARANENVNKTSEVGLNRTHLEKATIKHDTPSHYLEPTGKEKKGSPRNSLKRDAEAELHVQALNMTRNCATRFMFVVGLLLMAYVPHRTTDLS